MSISQQASAFNLSINSKRNIKYITGSTDKYYISPSDCGSLVVVTGSGQPNVFLPIASTVGDGFFVEIYNASSNNATFYIYANAGLSAGTIDNQTYLALQPGEGTELIVIQGAWNYGRRRTSNIYSDSATNQSGTKASAFGSFSVAIGGAATASSGHSCAIGWNSYSANGDAVCFGSWTSVQGQYSTGLGCSNSTIGANTNAQGSFSIAGSYANATDSFAGMITNNTTTYGTGSGATNSIAFGYLAKTGGAYSVALGGNATNAAYSYSIALGSAGTPSAIGKMAYGNASGNVGAGWGMISLYAATTNATATVMTSDGGAQAATNQQVVPNNSAFAFSGTVVGRQQAAGGTASAAWTISGLIRREGTAATTTLVTSTVTAISNVPAWTFAITADTTNGALVLTVTGAAATNIRWSAVIQSSEITYA